MSIANVRTRVNYELSRERMFKGSDNRLANPKVKRAYRHINSVVNGMAIDTAILKVLDGLLEEAELNEDIQTPVYDVYAWAYYEAMKEE